ncbi:MAG: rhodanese-like domain-containing protein [Candidatus Zixiibacteriota bacterium]|nr:MAG: rhodanese-like domain-containing protein [candidate division Zixibacteria bacterium]
MLLRQFVIIILVAAVAGVGLNLVSPNRIDFIGKYRSLSSGDGPIVPPTAEPGDPPFISIEVAELEHSNYQVVFIDARDAGEFVCGTIPGSVNIPFEYLPEGDLRPYIDSVLGGLPGDYHFIIFCSGEECDLSLHLGRTMQELGYTNLSIFFGGWREWVQFGLDVERRESCDG